jgi:hypothetical protein
MISIENIYSSIVYDARQALPSGILVYSGEAYGINLEDPTGKSPAVYVVFDEYGSDGYELGSTGSYANILYVINAKSRKQRDAIKTVLSSSILDREIVIYNFINNVASSVIGITTLHDHIRIVDTPDFSSVDEKSFWIATMYTRFNILET